MTLEPDHYECPDHQVDVTDQVTAKTNPDRPDGAYAFRPSWLGGRRPQGPETFEVIVTCPGSAAAGPHLLTCTGMLSP
jgi:hypothetical protein